MEYVEGDTENICTVNAKSYLVCRIKDKNNIKIYEQKAAI